MIVPIEQQSIPNVAIVPQCVQLHAALMKKYLVTGATGNVGSNVVTQLLESGERVRVFTRDPGKVAYWGNRIEVEVGDYGKPETFARAIAGVDGAFLMNVDSDGKQFRELIAAGKAQGKPKIVFLSTILAGSPAQFDLGKLQKDREDVIRESGWQGTFLRPSGFMSNSYQWSRTIKGEGVVYNPMGSGKTATIAPEDIAAVAVKALTSASFSNEVLELTGGELITVPEQVSILAKVLDKPIRCVDVTIEAAVQGLIRVGIPAPLASAVSQSYQAVRDGRAVMVNDTVEKVTGRRPRTFEAWARAHVSRFA
jgi:uncharacterized protein YbjT (DUF2867 family)